jgi:hypothetical protein
MRASQASLPIAGLRRRTTAALLTAHMAIACSGYRVTAKTGHHKASLDAITLALGAGAGKYAD